MSLMGEAIFFSTYLRSTTLVLNFFFCIKKSFSIFFVIDLYEFNTSLIRKSWSQTKEASLVFLILFERTLDTLPLFAICLYKISTDKKL